VKAAFLDRDGIINRDTGYVYRIEDFDFLPGIFELCAALHGAGYRLMVVTNQAGIARGIYTPDQMHMLHAWMREQFGLRGTPLAAIYFCPHHPEGVVPEFSRLCDCRKPKPGMILRARDEHGVDLAASLLLGNQETDIGAGIAAGVGTTVLLAQGMPPTTRATLVLRSLAELPRRLGIDGRAGGILG
jgi:D-glycero-D-manno-heptose 1,7-bisphosphate phosphatase